MTRPATPPSAGVKLQPTPHAETGPTEAPQAAGLTPAWRVALFLWATAFLCLAGYELLTTVVRSLSRLF
jgi:hypothetical protein